MYETLRTIFILCIIKNDITITYCMCYVYYELFLIVKKEKKNIIYNDCDDEILIKFIKNVNKC